MAYKFIGHVGPRAVFKDFDNNRVMYISDIDGSFVVKNISKGRKVWISESDVKFWLQKVEEVKRGIYNPIRSEAG